MQKTFAVNSSVCGSWSTPKKREEVSVGRHYPNLEGYRPGELKWRIQKQPRFKAFRLEEVPNPLVTISMCTYNQYDFFRDLKKRLDAEYEENHKPDPFDDL